MSFLSSVAIGSGVIVFSVFLSGEVGRGIEKLREAWAEERAAEEAERKLRRQEWMN